MIIAVDVHQRFRQWRDSLGISQEAMAKRLRYSQTFIALVEKGEKRFGLRGALTIQRMSEDWEHGPILASEWIPPREMVGGEA